MINQLPTYEELLESNLQLGERISELEVIIHEQELQINEFFSASTMYRELYMELNFNKQ